MSTFKNRLISLRNEYYSKSLTFSCFMQKEILFDSKAYFLVYISCFLFYVGHLIRLSGSFRIKLLSLFDSNYFCFEQSQSSVHRKLDTGRRWTKWVRPLKCSKRESCLERVNEPIYSCDDSQYHLFFISTCSFTRLKRTVLDQRKCSPLTTTCTNSL